MLAWSEDSNLEIRHELVLFHKILLTVPSLLSHIGSKSNRKVLPRKVLGVFYCALSSESIGYF